MAIGDFLGGSRYLQYAGASLTAVPLTISAWCWTDSVGGLAQTIVDLKASGAATNREEFKLLIAGTTDFVQMVTSDGSGSGTAATSTTITASTWFHACGVTSAANSRAAYLNGGGKGTNTGNRTPTGVNQTTVGMQGGTANNLPFGLAGGNGYIAEVAIWNVALTDADVTTLALGVHPFLVRPDALVDYWPLMGRYSPEINLKSNTRVLTVNGALVQFPHPRIFMPHTRAAARKQTFAGRGPLLAGHRNRSIVGGGVFG